MIKISVRLANIDDIQSILNIYNQGIEDRIATLELETKNIDYMNNWYNDHSERYSVLVAELDHVVVGWASLNRYSTRSVYDGVADLSIYIHRNFRGQGIGSSLYTRLESEAIRNKFYKIVLFTFPFNENGQGLYNKMGYRTVGVFEKQGRIDDQFVDVMIMEKIL
ncbi:MAG: arsinothricin resistance N-acetyltransferase ArsN1 family A [Candidatus Pristimantibacillus sp.]